MKRANLLKDIRLRASRFQRTPSRYYCLNLTDEQNLQIRFLYIWPDT